MQKTLNIFYFLTAFVFLSSCGFLHSYINDKSISGAGDSSTPVVTYSITPIFPISLSSFTGENASNMNVIVQVTADPVTLSLSAASVFQVYINDVLASLKPGTTNYYEATIPIATGVVQINVDIRKNNQSVQSVSSQITNQAMNPFADSLYGIGVSSDGSKAYVVGWNKEVMEVNLASGSRRVVTNVAKGVGSGPDVVDIIQAIDIDSSGTMAYLGGNTFGIRSVNIATGERAVHSQNGVRGTGPSMSWPNGIVIDSTDTFLYAVESFGRYIMRVDLATGDRTLASSDGTLHAGYGAGPALGNLRGAVLSSDDSTLYTIDTTNAVVLAIDLSNGNRTIISRGGGTPIGTGPEFTTSNAMGIESINNTNGELFLYGLSEIMKVTISNGNRSSVSNYATSTGSGPPLASINAMAGHEASGFLYGLSYDGEVFKINSTSGERSILKELTIGTGPTFMGLNNSLYDVVNKKVYTSTAKSVYAINTNNGARQLISDNFSGAGPNFGNIVYFAANSNFSFAYALDVTVGSNTGLNALLKVDLSNGDRTVISDSMTGSGPNITANSSTALAIDSTGTYGYISNTTSDEILQVNLSNGNRVVVSSSIVGTGTNLQHVIDLFVASDGLSLIALDATLKTVFEINIATGNRTEVASNSIGSGTTFHNVSFIVPGTTEDHFFVSSWQYPTIARLIKVDKATGNRTTVYDALTGTGFKTNFIQKFDKVLPDQRFYAPLAGGIGLIDITSVSRVIISR